ncbi:hypothetical protein Curi_c28860 [Gottschalkia acidurici 9a]|uniref:PEGA domain-containing protein n=1 Tax=Gottschalkia acidurici (strain ATCC 7906 / DSM 604 / BCRC 14475 / CIP 104303 / KCTC 5404 / NCIMB 10678 / 9a) TaxID=1128398 RepID=K0B4L5_GOTA9|nr:PEGA domain-containing protein [Gottschalkia acidurici]AFS79855.1 hypothetical protein Curi_c28860 [Gottschalkia acidurici 9a]
MSRKLQIIMGGLIIVLFLGFIFISIFKSNFNSEKLLAELYEAVDKGDSKYLGKYIKVKGKTHLIDEDVKKITNLLNNMGSMDIRIFDKEVDDSYNVFISKDGKEKLLYDKFVINVNTINLVLTTNAPNSKVYLDNKAIGETNDEGKLHYKNIIPGEYNVKVEYSGKYGKSEITEKIKIWNEVEDTIEVSLDLNIGYIDIYSNRDDAKLYVNGKDTGLLVKDIHNFGPIPLDGSITIQSKATAENGIIESDEKVVNHSTSYKLNLEDKENSIEETLNELVYNYEVGLVNAINYNDFSYASPYILKGSNLYNAQLKLIKNLNEQGIKEDYISHELIKVQKIDNAKYYLTVSESHKVYKADGGENIVKHTWQYDVQKVGDKYYLTNLK